MNARKSVKRDFLIIAIGIVLLLAFPMYVRKNFLFFSYGSPAMSTALARGTVVVKKIPDHQKRTLQRGDIIFYSDPQVPAPASSLGGHFKRVIGLPGESVSMKNGVVFINGSPLDEPYIETYEARNRSINEQVVPENHYFLLADSRGPYWEEAFVSDNDVVGKVIYPFSL